MKICKRLLLVMSFILGSIAAFFTFPLGLGIALFWLLLETIYWIISGKHITKKDPFEIFFYICLWPAPLIVYIGDKLRLNEDTEYI